MSDRTDTRPNVFGRIALWLACVAFLCMFFDSYVAAWLGVTPRALSRVVVVAAVLAAAPAAAELLLLLRRRLTRASDAVDEDAEVQL